MRILILSYYFPPELGSGPNLPFEMAETLVQHKHQVSVVTGFPRYHMNEMPEKYRGKFFYHEEMAGIQVYRVNAPNVYSSSRILRGLAQQIVPWLLAMRALFLPRHDVVVTSTPPLVMGAVCNFVARRFKAKSVVNVQDIFPQCAVDLGMIKNRAVIRFFEMMERRIYRKADAITVMSDGNRDLLVGRGADANKTQSIFNWVDTDLIQPGERMNAFRMKHGLADKFVVTFAGTMGWSQGLNVVVDAARLLERESNILFLMVGDGVEREQLKKRAADLKNVRFLPMQSREEYPHVLAASNACLVVLRPEVVTPTVPSKISTIMAAGRPILASIPLDGDAPKIIEEAQCGITSPADDDGALANAVLELYRNPELAKSMEGNGRRFAMQRLARNACVEQYERLFEKLMDETDGSR
jgi:colanic acid biosynthesis glycosyl transferase WcaI